jgi:hypothetical protein
VSAGSSIGVAQHARCLTILQLEREIAAATDCGADRDYIDTLRAILDEKRTTDSRDTEPPPAPEPEESDAP